MASISPWNSSPAIQVRAAPRRQAQSVERESVDGRAERRETIHVWIQMVDPLHGANQIAREKVHVCESVDPDIQPTSNSKCNMPR